MQQLLRRYASNLKLQSVRGTHDLLPQTPELHTFEFIVDKAKTTAKQYLYQPIYTPILEYKEVFHRTLGTESDVVSKEMFSAVPMHSSNQQSDELNLENTICLRPEMTASVARSIIQHNLYSNLPHRMYYMGPMFRMERPQKGRYRQFHQFGVENIGSSAYQTDVEMIQMAHQFLQSIGLYKHPNSVTLEINTLGSAEDRIKYREILVQYLETRKSNLSIYAQQKLERGSVLKVLDSKEPTDMQIIKDAPKLLEVIQEKSLAYFETITKALELCNIPYTISPFLVRGLDYYCHTTFEFKTTQTGKNTVLAGGRYDQLLEMMGGKSLPAIGWACGIERLMHAISFESDVKPTLQTPIIIMIAKVNTTMQEQQEILNQEALRWTHRLRMHFRDVEKISIVSFDKTQQIKKQFEYANSIGAEYVVVIGVDELNTNSIKLKNMKTREEITLKQEEFLFHLRNLIVPSESK